MSTIIRSDIYRLKKGKTVKITLLVSALLAFLILALSLSFSSIVTNIPTDGMSATDIAEMQADVAEMQSQTAGTGASYVTEINGQNFMIFLFLAVIVAVFSTDFDNGTYKNTLSYESNRNKVFWGKFILTFFTCILIKIVTLFFSFLSALIFIGTSGFSVAFWLQTLLAFVFQLPIYISIIAVAFCIVTFTKKTAALNVIFLVGLTVVSVVFQMVSALKDTLNWLVLFDPLTASTQIAQGTLNAKATAFSLCFFTAISIIALLIGSIHFKKSDLH